MASNSSVEQCMTIIRELDDMVATSRRALLQGNDSYIINRDQVLDRLKRLQAALPGAMTTAAEYVKNINAIREQTEQECTTLRRDAQQESQQMLADARQKAGDMTANAEQAAKELATRANNEAYAMMEAARQEANRVLEDAARRADMMVSQEEIVRRAHVEASETRETAEREMTQLRKNTFDYLESVMDQADRFLSDAVSHIRMEKGELNNHR